MVSPRNDSDTPIPKRPPATTPQARENQLIALAYDEAEKQIRGGKATSQLLTHFLKLGTAKEQLERTKLERENKLLDARVDQIAAGGRMEELTERAINAFRSYSGNGDIDDYDE